MSEDSSTPINLYRCTPRQTKKFATKTMAKGRVPFVKSSPGMGKSSIFKEIAKENNLELIDLRLSTVSPVDLSGLPEFYTDDAGIRRSRFVPFEMFPVVGTPLPKGKDGWLLFLDEANSATKMVQASCYKLVLDRYAGMYPLHERCAVAMAGNHMTDRAIVQQLSTAMQSRVIHIDMELNHKDFIEDVVLARNWDSRILAFLNFDPDALMDFRPDHDGNTFNCPRTWEFMNDLIQGEEVKEEDTPLYAGTITAECAAKFVQFTQVFHNMVKLGDIVSDPAGCSIPGDPSTKWAVVSEMAGKVTDKNFGDLSTYFNRWDITFKVLFFRAVMIRHPELRGHSAFAKAMIDLSRYLHAPTQLKKAA